MSYLDGLASRAYDVWRSALDDGRPEWFLLSDLEQSAWRAAVRAVLGAAP